MSDEPPQRTWRARLAALRLDLTPLRVSRDYRNLTFSGAITMLGSYITFIAVPIQMKELTGSPFAVGAVALAEFVPMVLCGLYGGALADAVDRRTMVIWSEAGLMVLTGALLLNALLPTPQVWVLYVVAAGVAACDGLQRPSLDGLVPRYLPHGMMASAGALNSLRWNFGAIVGPAVGGLLVAYSGVQLAYFLDVLTFGLSLLLLLRLSPAPPRGEAQPASLRSIAVGLRYAVRRPDLAGTYLIDMVAMAMAMVSALYPFMADRVRAPWALGLMYSAGAVGALLAALTSGWTQRVHRHGMAVIVSAAAWGAVVAVAGRTTNVWLLLACLVVAGSMDMVSGLFRSVIWNQSIPDGLRGRLAGIELLSYSSGPLIGNARAGFVAEWRGVPFAVISGGIACVTGVVALAAALPAFRRYDARTDEHVLAEAARRKAQEEQRSTTEGSPAPG
ncbi:MFS family permease [Crossiella equi]|uniref:MFS family permease n=1 Tax=Crossiella equi TaxID=130796 RepID=A0ABS5APE7_9PSEU|nr:MFS transporter [Crossiella equi]MBP2478127.1 MFS family permease [Crossiella equi]